LRAEARRTDSDRSELVRSTEFALDKIESAIDRAVRISRNFLRFARAPDAVVRTIDLGELAAEVRDLTGKMAAHSDVAIELLVNDGAVRSVASDPYQLRQVLLNLVTNAIQAVGPHGRVEIRVGGGPDEVRIEVCDNGPGIPEEHLERIFEPFFTTKGEGQGTGLGLAVSRGIVEKLGGCIEVENRPGEGCTFRLILPRSRV
jgi:signal transduction histidine kinase